MIKVSSSGKAQALFSIFAKIKETIKMAIDTLFFKQHKKSKQAKVADTDIQVFKTQFLIVRTNDAPVETMLEQETKKGNLHFSFKIVNSTDGKYNTSISKNNDGSFRFLVRIMPDTTTTMSSACKVGILNGKQLFLNFEISPSDTFGAHIMVITYYIEK